jgi:hypothetical protein
MGCGFSPHHLLSGGDAHVIGGWNTGIREVTWNFDPPMPRAIFLGRYYMVYLKCVLALHHRQVSTQRRLWPRVISTEGTYSPQME